MVCVFFVVGVLFLLELFVCHVLVVVSDCYVCVVCVFCVSFFFLGGGVVCVGMLCVL